MKQPITLSIANPCSENWNSFAATAQGAFCGSCQKEVIDFTTMTDAEVMAYFQQRHGHVCGRFTVQQLKTYKQDFVPVNAGWKLFAAGCFSLLLLLSSKPTFAQQPVERVGTELVSIDNAEKKSIDNDYIHVSGKVIDDAGEEIPGVNVMIKGTTIGTNTNVDGEFSFENPVKVGSILQFSFIGFETKEYVVRDNRNATISLNIDMKLDDVVLMGEVAMLEEKPSITKRIWYKLKSIL
jgi:hypothetical protein